MSTLSHAIRFADTVGGGEVVPLEAGLVAGVVRAGCTTGNVPDWIGLRAVADEVEPRKPAVSAGSVTTGIFSPGN